MNIFYHNRKDDKIRVTGNSSSVERSHGVREAGGATPLSPTKFLLHLYMNFDPTFFANLTPLLVLLGIWDIVWKGMGLWQAARNGQKYWFVAILIINSVGILPIIYLKFFQKKKV